MASLFLSMPRYPQNRIVAHGGLGGFVYPVPVVDDVMQTKETELPDTKRRGRVKRRRPPPIQVETTSSESFTGLSDSQLSVSSDIDSARPWTPITPTDHIHATSLLQRHTVTSSTTSTPTTTTCSLVSRHFPVEPFVACLSPPQTPIHARDTFNHSLPAELPGSLLQASQGFPQTNPISPPPSLHRRDTEESSPSCPPAPSISSTTHEFEMDSFRHLTYPLRRNDRGGGAGDMPTYVIRGQPLPEPLPKITKPLTAMNLEELLQCLPRLDTTTVSELWLPAVRVHLREVTSLFHDACQLKLDALHKETISNNVCLLSTPFHSLRPDPLANILSGFGCPRRGCPHHHRHLPENNQIRRVTHGTRYCCTI